MAHPRAMDVELRELGTWFLPGPDARVVPGAFTWKDRDGRLELHDSLLPFECCAGPTGRHAVVHGNLYTGEAVTLFDAVDTGPQHFFVLPGQPAPQTLSSLHAVVGAHLDETSSIAEFSARVPGLQHWLNRDWFSTEVERSEGQPLHVTIAAKYPKPAVFGISGANVQLGLDVLPEHNGQGGFVMSTMGRVTIIPTEPQSFDWLLERFCRVTSLLTLMAGAPIAPDQVSITPAGAKTDASVLLLLRNPETCAFAKQHDFFLIEQTLGIDLAEVLSRWFEAFDSVNLPSRLAVDVLNDSGNTYMDFLGVMQALEGFHRGRYGGVYMDQQEFEEARVVVAVGVPPAIKDDHRDSFLARIQYGNEYSLRKRMKELVASLPNAMQLAIVGKEGNLPGYWIDSRNAYTHWSREGMDQAMQGADLYGAIHRLKMLLRVGYLKMLGVTDSAIMSALQGRSEVSRRLRQLPRPSAPKPTRAVVAAQAALRENGPSSDQSRGVEDQQEETAHEASSVHSPAHTPSEHVAGAASERKH